MRDKTKRYIAGIILLAAGTLLSFLVFMGSISITPELSAKHPAFVRFWVIGTETGSFLKYLFGKSFAIFGFIIIYLGYLFLRDVNRFRKLLLGIAGLTAFLALTYLFSLYSKGPPFEGGGITGKFLISLFKPILPKVVMYAILITVIGGLLFIILKHPIWVVKDLILNKINRRRKENSYLLHSRKSISSPEPVRETVSNAEDGVGAKNSQLFKIKSLIPFLRKIRRCGKRKPPLVRKVILDENGLPIDFHYEPRYDPQHADRQNESVKLFQKEKHTLKEGEEAQLFLYKEQEQGEDTGITGDGWTPPKTSFLRKSRPINLKHLDRETSKKARDLEKTLSEFGIEARVVNIIRGPVITRYELQPAPGVKLSRIVNLSDNIALSLSASGVRIEAPIPGQSAVGIEIPNIEREMVTLGDIIEKANGGSVELPLVLGKDISGRVVTADLAIMPHLLIAGATGSGKSVCVNSLIVSLLYKKSPSQVRFLMIDPKMVELKIYNGIPHLLTEVVTDPRAAGKALRWVLREMEHRYRLLDEAIVRDIKGYNQKSRNKLPYIIIIVDEFANLMAISQKDVEDAVVRLAAMSRAVGIHLIMATQRPSVDVITGLIKANFPYRIAFQVASKTDSRTILDTVGAEKLLGRGDMLFSPAGAPAPIRIQGAYISEEEVIRIVEELKRKGPPEYIDDIIGDDSESNEDFDGEDPIFNDAVEIVLKTKRASASFLQRRLRIGYNRAARLIELMEEKGIIGPPRGSKPREIFIDN